MSSKLSTDMKTTLKQPKTWRKVKLGEFSTLHRGYDLPVEQMKKGEYPVIFSNGKIEHHKEYKIKGPGVITGRSGTLGNTFYIEENFWPHNTTLYVSDFHGNNQKFVYYLLKRLNLARLNAGSGVPTLNRNHVHQILVDIPKNPSEQKCIADILSAFDDKIELNNKINRNLEQTAQAIFKEWFVKNQKSKIKNQKLGDLVNIEYGRGPASSQLKKSGYPVYGANGVIGYFDSYNFSDRQIIIGCRGVVGNVTLTLPKCIVTHNSLIITPRSKKKLFFYYLLRNQNLGAIVGGSAQPQITITDLERLDLLMPDEKLQDRFELVVDAIEQKHLNIFYENQKLASLRDLLLPKLMSGEIKV